MSKNKIPIPTKIVEKPLLELGTDPLDREVKRVTFSLWNIACSKDAFTPSDKGRLFFASSGR